MSISQLIEMTRRSFRTIDAGINVAGQNVANANTEGYVRRRLTLQSDTISMQGIQTRPANDTFTGAGVSVQLFTRARDTLLSKATWTAMGDLGAAKEEHRLLGAMESVFPLGAGALNNQLNDFWNDWSTLADNPTDSGVRVVLSNRGASLSSTLNRMDADLQSLHEESTAILSDTVDDINRILERITMLNADAQAARSAGSANFGVEDERDQLVRELAEIAPVSVNTEASMGYAIFIDGISVLDGNTALELTLDTTNAPYTIAFGDTGINFIQGTADKGMLGALMRTVNTTIPNARSQLDAVANALVTQVNALHTTGYGLDNTNGRDFFDANGTTASTIDLSAAVKANSNVIAASGATDAIGDSSIASSIAALRSTEVMSGNTETIDAFAINIIGDIGAKVISAGAKSESHTAVVNNLDALERGISGVSVDEEMSRLIELQQSFAATARVLSSIQEMMDTLFSI